MGLGLAAVLSLGTATFAQDEFTAPLTELAKGEIAAFASDPALIAAIAAQNAVTGAYDQAQIDALDTQWRAEVGAASKPLIDATLANAASQYLAGVQEASAGKYTEIFAMDAKGLNVGQSTLTSDYWQGDEDKFTASFGAGADAVHIGEIEQDESTQIFQSQVSVPITDPATGAVIGAITVGVDVSML
ncbi:hypothetical protein IM737_11985 [Devosia sp. SL43]|nr:hypothetical protein IM737_11985 [Devosia sp. SL43]